MKKIFYPLTTLLLTACLYATANAHGFNLGPLEIAHPYANSSMPGQAVGGVFFKHIANKGDQADQMISASVDSSVAERTELHTMNTENDIMRMRQVTTIDIPAKATVPMTRGLKKDGYHVMLMGLKAPLKEGDKIPLKLKFKLAGEVIVTVNVEALKPDSSMPQGHKH